MKQNIKFLFVFLALGLLISCARAPQQLVSEKSAAPVVDLTSKKIRDAIVWIESENASGTGFFVAPDKIATNTHVVAHAGPVSVKSPDKKKDWTIEGVVGFDAKNSLVILKLTGEGRPLPLGNGDAVQIGEPISILGYPDGEFKVTEGSIQSIQKNNRWLRLNTTTAKKTNGSPVFNSNGQLIGIIVPYGGSAVSVASLEALLDKFTPMEPLAAWQQRKQVRAAASYSLGKEKFRVKDYAGALIDFDKAIEFNPAYVRAYYERGRTQDRLGDYDSAIAACTQVLEMDPDEADAYYGLGTIKAKLGDYTEAIVDLDKAIELDAQHAEAYSNRGGVKFALGESETAHGNAEKAQSFEAAIADCNKAIKIDPEDAYTYNFRGGAKLALGDFDEAILDFNRTIEIDPKHTDAFNNRGAAKVRLGDFEDERGNTKEARRLYEMATVDYNKAIQINPKHADAHKNRAIVKCKLADIEFEYGNAEIAQNLYPEGITDYDKSIRLNTPDNIDPKTADPAFTKTENSTVHIMKWTGTSNSFSTGSGFFVAEDKIVTNIHVVAEPGPVFAQLTGREEIWAVDGVTAYDIENDLAVLKITGKGTPLSLGDSDILQSGEFVVTVGYPHKKYTFKQVAIHSIRNSDQWIRMKVDFGSGSSGGPVLNSSSQVVGINAFEVSIEDVLYSLAIPSNTLKALLTPSASTVPLREWQNRDPIRAYVYDTQGKNKYDADEYEAAIADFDKAIKLNPRNIHTYYRRGIAKNAFGKHKAAIADFDKAIEINTEAVHLYLGRRNAKHALSDYEGAIADLDKAIQLYPEHPDLYNDRGEVQFRLGAAEFSGGNVEKAQALYEAAIEDCTQAIKLNPEHAEARSNLGTVKSALSAMRGQ